jgi:hypothetical protein
MCIRLLEIVRAVQWIKPGVQEELGPLSSADNEAPLRKALFVLGENQINVGALQMWKSLDNTIWWYHGLVSQHHTFQLLCIHDGVLNCLCWVHDQRILIEEPDKGGVRKFR